MPRYSTKRKKRASRAQKHATRGYTRDKRILKNWAVRGTDKDYARLRRLADKHSADPPSYILPQTFDELATIDRGRMVQNLHDEPHGGSWFMDGLNWLVGRIPASMPWKWISWLSNAAKKPWAGSSLTETDSEYAKLVDASYQGDRPELVENWRRLDELDGEYCSAWESADGHILVAVRGTVPSHGKDLAQDALIMTTGHVVNDISRELRRIIDAVPRDKTIDLAAHSLGTSLAVTAYENNPDIYDRINQTYLYNPAMSPLSIAGNVTEKYEKDPKVRYFISLSDPVSVGDIGNEPPVNAVFRTGNILHPMAEHDIGSWYPGTYEDLDVHQTDDKTVPLEQNADSVAATAGSAVRPMGEHSVTFGDDFNFDAWEENLGNIH